MDRMMTLRIVEHRTPIFLAGAASMAAAVDALVKLDGRCKTCISSTPPVVATIAGPKAWSDPFVTRIADWLETSTVVTPPSMIRSLIPRQGDWIKISLGTRSDRLD